MSISQQQKDETISRFRRDEKDTGSTEVQVAVLTRRIQNLTEHFKTHKKDNHSRRGLLLMVSRRRKLLAYLKRISLNRYQELIHSLELRK